MKRAALGVDGKPIRFFASARALRTWLAREHGKSSGIWVRFAKKASGVKSVTYDEALDIALCYGWIDGQARSDDETYYLQKFTPRAKRSMWSKRNREKVAALIESGAMQPPGLAEVERAKADGRWDAAYDPPSKIGMTKELEAALKKNKRAREFFETLDRTNRYAILYRVQLPKRAETRERKVKEFVAMLARGEKVFD